MDVAKRTVYMLQLSNALLCTVNAYHEAVSRCDTLQIELEHERDDHSADAARNKARVEELEEQGHRSTQATG